MAEVGSLTQYREPVVIGKENLHPASARDGKSINAEIKTLNKGGAPKVCRYCLKKTDHVRALCPAADLSPIPGNPAACGSFKTIYVPDNYFDDKANAIDNSVIVTKLSEDTCEADLIKLVGTFGHLHLVRVAKDEKTGKCKGFALVQFANIDDAEKAKNKLNADGYHIKWFI